MNKYSFVDIRYSMSAKIFKKLVGLACAFAIGVVSFALFYSVRLSRTKVVELQKSFYFLVSTDSRVEVSVEFTKLDGGAGYLLEKDNVQYVALAVYLNKEDGIAVQEGLGEELPTKILHKGVSALYFKGKDKKESALYVNALRTLEGCISVLNECIARLEKGSTQENCKRILEILQRQFAFAQKEYENYPAFFTSCGEWLQSLKELCEETVYVQKLRYLLCWQVEGYLALCEGFSL